MPDTNAALLTLWTKQARFNLEVINLLAHLRRTGGVSDDHFRVLQERFDALLDAADEFSDALIGDLGDGT